MENKELLAKAINNYTPYTKFQRRFLNLLIDIAVDNIIVVTVIRLHEITGTSRQSIYKAISLFEKDRIIEPIKDIDGSVRDNAYKLNMSIIEKIIKHYTQKKAVVRDLNNIIKK